MYASGSALPSFENATLSHNTASQLGGAVHAQDSATISFTAGHNVLHHNQANSGGALYLGSTETSALQGCHFHNNVAQQFGGAITLHQGGIAASVQQAQLANTSFVGNTAEGRGGGALYWTEAGTELDAEWLRQHVHFSGNSAPFGDDFASGECESACLPLREAACGVYMPLR